MPVSLISPKLQIRQKKKLTLPKTGRNLLSIEKGDVRNRRCKSCEAQPIGEGEKDTEVDFAIPIIARYIKIKGLLFQNSCYVVTMTGVVESLGGEQWKSLGFKCVGPICNWNHYISKQAESYKGVHYGVGWVG